MITIVKLLIIVINNNNNDNIMLQLLLIIMMMIAIMIIIIIITIIIWMIKIEITEIRNIEMKMSNNNNFYSLSSSSFLSSLSFLALHP